MNTKFLKLFDFGLIRLHSNHFSSIDLNEIDFIILNEIYSYYKERKNKSSQMIVGVVISRSKLKYQEISCEVLLLKPGFYGFQHVLIARKTEKIMFTQKHIYISSECLFSLL